MDILIESTKDFERDLANLGENERAAVIEKINDCASLFPTKKAAVYRKMHRLRLPSLIDDYESSLYTLRISQKLRVILAVDEDPIFEQAIFTLFRAVQHNDLNKAYKDIADSLYQELPHQNREVVKMS